MVIYMSIEIGERVKQVRGTLNQRDFAEKLGVSKGSISQIEQGKAMPGGEFLLRIHAAFGVDVTWLLTGMGSQPAVTAASAQTVSAEEACRPYTVADYCGALETQNRADLARTGSVTAREAAERLSRDEQVLLDNYRHLSAQDKAVLKATSDAFASAARVKGKAG